MLLENWDIENLLLVKEEHRFFLQEALLIVFFELSIQLKEKLAISNYILKFSLRS